MCPDHELISAYLDGELPLPEQRAIKAHVEDCLVCQVIYRNCTTLSEAFSRLDVPATSEHFMSQLLAQLPTPEGHPTQTTLSAYYDQALATEEHAEVSLHVTHCRGCTQTLQQYQQLSQGLQNLSTPTATVDFVDRLLTQVQAQHPDFETLSAYQDDELPPAELKAVAMHIATCTDCQAQLNHLQQISSQVAALKPPTVSDGFMSQLMAQVEATQHPDIETLSAYHDGVLAAEERPTLKAHVAQCQSCQYQLAGFAQLTTTLQALPQPTACADFISRLEAQLPTPAVAPTAKILYFSVALRSRYSRMAAGLAAFGLLAVWASQYLGPQTHGIANQELTKQIIPVQYRAEDELFVSDIDTFSLDTLDNPVQDDYNKLLGGQS